MKYPKKLTLELTIRDFRGNYYDPQTCPLSLAFRRTMKLRTGTVSVGHHNIDVKIKGMYKTLYNVNGSEWDAEIARKILTNYKVGGKKPYKVHLLRKPINWK
jgi:hypothetical protein